MHFNAYLSIPDSPIGNLIIVHENRGLDDHIRDVANRFALEGFAVVAPDYLSPIGGSVPDIDTNIANIKNISRKHVTDISLYWSGVLSKTSQNTDWSILGFCWGGGVVNHCVTKLQSIDKAIMFYGTAPDLELTKDIKANLQLHYAEYDDRINAGKDDYQNSLEESGINFETYTYEGTSHAFFNDTRTDRYHKESAATAFKRVITFLKG